MTKPPAGPGPTMVTFTSTPVISPGKVIWLLPSRVPKGKPASLKRRVWLAAMGAAPIGLPLASKPVVTIVPLIGRVSTTRTGVMKRRLPSAPDVGPGVIVGTIGGVAVAVGAGAWEVRIPLYQRTDTTLETDYYVHNEFLQLLSEYGLVVGGLALAFLLAYLLQAAHSTWSSESAPRAALRNPRPALHAWIRG